MSIFNSKFSAEGCPTLFDNRESAIAWILMNIFVTQYYEKMSVTEKVELAEALISEQSY